MKMKQASQNKNNSLQRVVLEAILFCACTILVMFIVLDGLIVIGPTLRAYKREAKHLGNFVTSLIGNEYLEQCYAAVKDVYYSTPEEIRADQFADDYVQRIIVNIDNEYKANRNMISACRSDAELQNIYYVFYDEEYDRMVIVFDGNERSRAFLPGQWISNENGSIESLPVINKTISSEWFMPVSYGEQIGFVGTDYEGIYDSEGNLIGYQAITITINTISQRINTFLALVIPVLIIFMILIGIRINKWIKKRFLSPIERLTERAGIYNELSKAKEGKEKGGVFKDLNINTGDELEVLWRTMVDMEDDIDDAMKRIAVEAAESERMATELETARNIQCGIVPLEYELKGEGFEAFGCGHPARMVGGDFYDIFQLDSDNTCVIVGDISGKGISAALFMIMVKSTIREKLRTGESLSEALNTVNKEICKSNPESMFATVFAARLDTKTGILTFANAGHNPPVVLADTPSFLDVDSGIILGLFEDMNIQESSITLKPGQGIFIYTDGVTEAFNKNDEEYGGDRLIETISTSYSHYNNSYDSKLVVSDVVDSVNLYSQGLDQSDDITCAAIIYNPN